MFFYVCQQEELFWMKIVCAFMFDGPKREELRLANWIGRATSVIPGGQHEVFASTENRYS